MLYRLKMQMENIASAVTARVKRFLERMEGHARVRMVLFFALLVLIGILMVTGTLGRLLSLLS